MSGMNFGNGFAAGGGADALESLWTLLAKQADMAEQRKLEQQRVGLEGKRLQNETDYKNVALKDREDAQAAARQMQASTRADKLADDLVPNQRLTAGAEQTLKAGERGDLVTPAPLSSENISGNMLRGQLRMAPNPSQGPIYKGTAGQLRLAQQRDDTLAARDQARQDRLDAAEQAKRDREELIRLTASLRPAPQPPIALVQTVDANGNPVTRMVEKKAGSEFQKPVGAQLEGRVKSAETVNQTGEDIIRKLSDPKYAATLGPALGRASSLRDFIGNPPPEFSELAGQIESYALANMGVHGMRSAQGAEQIKKLLTGRHTPESLAATIRGLNDFSTRFVQNSKHEPAGGAPAAAGKPTAADLIKKYGGG